MKESILLAIAAIFAVVYNIILLMAHQATANDELTTTSAFLTVLNTFKDTAILTIILFNIFLR